MIRMSQTTTVQSPARQGAGSALGRPTVPWLTVLPLAVLIAYADGFWMTSLRGAAGAIERTDGPFGTWLRESTLALPVFVLAVLGALTLAMRWFGPVLGNTRAVIGTGLMVVGAGTLVGIVELAASSAYDYHLQATQLQMVVQMGHACASGNCLPQQEQASLALQVQAVGYGSALLLATNLLLVAWAVAIRGGRLAISATRGQARTMTARADEVLPQTRSAGAEERGSRVHDLRLILAAGLLGTAAIHAAVVPEHLAEWGAAGAFFIVLAAAELLVAVLLAWPEGISLLALPQRMVLLAAAVVSVSPLALWLYSRTLGMPFGPEPGVPEAVGLADVASSVLELGTLVVAVVLLRGRDWTLRPRVSAHLRWLIVVAVIAVTAVGLAGTGLRWFDVRGDLGEQPAMSSLH
jgi:hypothetical protein